MISMRDNIYRTHDDESYSHLPTLQSASIYTREMAALHLGARLQSLAWWRLYVHTHRATGCPKNAKVLKKATTERVVSRFSEIQSNVNTRGPPHSHFEF